jgi:hypothetical protein
MQHRQGHAEWTWTCIMNMNIDMQHEPEHAVWA